MELESFLSGIEVRARSGKLPAKVAGLHYDSRRIEPGWAFVAIHGESDDGNRFVPQARARGAALVLSELPGGDASLPWVQVASARTALAQASGNWFGHPAERLVPVGITGTNGKTTTSFLIEALLRAAGWKTGLLGTIEFHIGDRILPSTHTSPESRELQQYLADMVAVGCRAAVMEVSSHALAMQRVWGVRFAAAVFTNLTQDHLDFHKTMDAYAAAKRRLFEGSGAPPPGAAVVNADDAWSEFMVRDFRGKLLRYGFSADADFRAVGLANRPAGLEFELQGPEGWRGRITSPLLGRVNALNLMAALATGCALGLDPAAAMAAAGSLPRVRGRFERIYAGQPFTVVVDYAHTPDAISNVLALARELATGRVGIAFGCGGDRDRGKRPLMGRAAAVGADWVLLTSDNPRSEEPEAILREIAAGAPAAECEPDRHRAIRRVIKAAQPGDVVVIAGKGHEDYQITGDRRLPFDDAAEARAALQELGWKG